MSDEIIKVLDNLGSKFGIAIDWTSQNVMPYLQDLMGRFILYRNITGGVQIAIWLVLTITSSIAIKKLIKWRKSDKYYNTFKETDEDSVFGFSIFLAIGILILSVCMIIGNIFGIIQNICMPELTILEYIKNSMN